MLLMEVRSDVIIIHPGQMLRVSAQEGDSEWGRCQLPLSFQQSSAETSLIKYGLIPAAPHWSWSTGGSI